LARSLIQHNAEKGRVVEGVVKSALRSILPGRFSLGTGFVVTASGQTSPQLDVVIYDAFQNAPIILEGGVGIFPIECVYAFVEVKSRLETEELSTIASAIGLVRRFAAEKRYEAYKKIGQPDKIVSVAVPIPDELPPRSYVFALRSKLSASTILEKIGTLTEEANAHVHGLAAIEPSLFIKQRPHKLPHQFDSWTDKAMGRFAASVLQGVQSFPMRPAAMGRYLGSSF
jgi:hypothetical protein